MAFERIKATFFIAQPTHVEQPFSYLFMGRIAENVDTCVKVPIAPSLFVRAFEDAPISSLRDETGICM